jgi:hypothetical protein
MTLAIIAEIYQLIIIKQYKSDYADTNIWNTVRFKPKDGVHRERHFGQQNWQASSGKVQRPMVASAARTE